MPKWLASPARQLAALVVSVIVLFAIVLYITGALTRGATAKVEAKLSGNQVGAAQASGRDAVNTMASNAASEAAIDTITMENDRAIRSAPGAGAPVDPALRDTGLASLCRRAAYSRDQRCLQFTPAR